MDNREDEAVTIVARDLIAWAVREHADDAPRPPVTAAAWARVTERALELAPQVDGDAYLAAAGYLSGE